MNKINPTIIQGISYDLQYFFTNKGVVKISLEENDLKTKNILEYSLENLDLGIQLMKENLQTKFDLGLIDTNEYSYSARKFIYKTLDTFKPKHQINIVKEWEDKFGKNLLFINENLDRTDLRKLFNNSWKGVEDILLNSVIQPILEQKTTGRTWAQWAGQMAGYAWDDIKKTVSKAFSCASGSGYIECFMEGLRTIATSLLGVTILTSVSFIPAVGQVPNFVIFGALLIYDLWKMMTGKKYNVSDIVVDIVSLLTPWIAGKIGGYLKGVSSFFGLGKIAGSGVLGTFIKSLSKGIGSLANFIGKTVGFFSTKLGITWLGDMAKYASSGLTKITTDITAGQKSAEKTETKVTKSEPSKGWEKFPCVVNSTNLKQIKLSDGSTAYKGDGYVWYGNGRRRNTSDNSMSNYYCDVNDNIKAGLDPSTTTDSKPEIDKGTEFANIDGKKITIDYYVCSSFPFELGCINDKIKRVQSCLEITMDGKFTPEVLSKLKTKGYGDKLTEDVYDKIMKDCGSAPEGSALPSSVFSKDI